MPAPKKVAGIGRTAPKKAKAPKRKTAVHARAEPKPSRAEAKPMKKPIEGLFWADRQANKASKSEGRSEHSERGSLFWADQIAAQLVERAKKAGKHEMMVKAGASPSGAKHIGNLFDVIKAYIVYKAVRDKHKFPVKFVLTHDDRDPMRSVPRSLYSRTGQRIAVDAAMRDKLSGYLGHPYHRIPDPFDCCRTWAEHFSKVWEDGIIACGVREADIKFVSNDTLYREGKFDHHIRMIFEHVDRARKAIAPFQKNVKKDYVPFNAICGQCGKITAKITGWDLKKKTVKYACEMKALAGKYVVQGCGKQGEAPWSEGKIAWRFEWPAQWQIFGVDFEAFGKEHAEGSWPSGRAIAKEFYGFEPPVTHIYEFLMIDGAKMAASKGNVYIPQEMLEILEPEVFMYLYTKRSKKERNLDLKNIHLLVNDFELAEKKYFGIAKEENEKELAQLRREYESCMPILPKAPPLRIDYQFASLVAQFAVDLDHAVAMLRKSGHIKPDKHLTPEELSQVARRLSLAKNWVDRFATENKIKINDTLPQEIKGDLKKEERFALVALGKLLHEKITQEELHNSFYRIAQDSGIEPRDFYRAAYLAIIGKESGPRLAPFIMALGTERVRRILEQV